jgi:hypothetical protein
MKVDRSPPILFDARAILLKSALTPSHSTVNHFHSALMLFHSTMNLGDLALNLDR